MTDNTKQIKCVLFDLDGTLLDTSYDFTFALNKTCRHFDQAELPYQSIRQIVSQGGLAMTQLAFPNLTGEALEEKRKFFLQTYQSHIAEHTDLFPGLVRGMNLLAEFNIPWGIVTNKPEGLTRALLEKITFPSAPQSIVCGDTLPTRKPNPAPMRLAAEQCGVLPEECLYLGDHPRDIEAGVNAKMQTGAALFGYLPDSSLQTGLQDWPADYFFQTPLDIVLFIEQLVKQFHPSSEGE